MSEFLSDRHTQAQSVPLSGVLSEPRESVAEAENRPQNLLALKPAALVALLAHWQQAGLLSRLDLALVRFLHNYSSDAAQPNAVEASQELGCNSTTLLLAALLSHQVGRGHVCLPLAPLFSEPEHLLKFPTADVINAKGEFVAGLASLLQGLCAADLIAALHDCPAVFAPDAEVCPSSSAPTAALPLAYSGQPLVLVTEPANNPATAMATLYLTRYWQYEQQIAAYLTELMQPLSAELPAATVLTEWLNDLFMADRIPVSAQANLADINWQKLACVNTLRSRFSVITGGPGTGKTYTVVRLLALLQRLTMQSQAKPLVIKLAAPTGKAAARLKEAIQAAATQLQALPASWAEALSHISAESATLHKLLGVQAGSRQFKHRAGNPLALDVLIVDEASMIDIELMQALLAALPLGARLVLLGDKDQLASVEAGAVLGQLCDGAEQGGYRSDTLHFLQQFSQVRLPPWLLHTEGAAHLQHVVMLRVSRRFNDSSGIGALARAVNQGDLTALCSALGTALGIEHKPTATGHLAASDTVLLPSTTGSSKTVTSTAGQSSPYQDIRLIHCTDPSNSEQQQQLIHALQQLCQQGFSAYWQAIKARPARNCSREEWDNWARSVLSAYQGFQLLTPVREGPFGVTGLNTLVQQTLRFLPSSNAASNQQNTWYEGRPVMITANDYNLNLRNGDIGMVLNSPEDGQKRAVFIDSDNKVRWILPSRLNEVETVFAMTVHKSQGSEFSHTVMVLPERDNPVLSRELLYTGITRAAQQLTLVVPNLQVLAEAVKRKTVRAGRLSL